MVVGGNVVLSGFRHSATGFLHKRVNAASPGERLAEIVFADLLLRKRLNEVVASADLPYDLVQLRVDGLFVHRHIQLLCAGEQQLRADGLLLRLFRKSGEILLDFIGGHSMRSVELHEPVQLELYRFLGNGFAVYVCLFHFRMP